MKERYMMAMAKTTRFCKKCKIAISINATLCRSCSKKGISLSEEHKQKLRISAKIRPKMTEMTKLKIAQANTGKKD